MTNKILVVGQTPPPYHGQSIMIEALLKNPLKSVKFYHIRMHFSKSISDIGKFRLMKVYRLLIIILKIYFYRIAFNIKVLYYPVSGPNKVPVYRDIVILLTTRWLFLKTIFHFHAAGISHLYPQLSRFTRFIFQCAFYKPFAAIRLTELTPEDAKFLEAKHEYLIPYGIEDPLASDNSSKTVVKDTDDILRILFVGILHESKGVMVLLDACCQLLKMGVAFRIELMGEFKSPEFQARVYKRIIELQLEPYVTFLGVLTGTDKDDAFKRANCLCFPTFYELESFGVVLLEAMAFGLSIVTTNWRSIPTIIDNGKTGYLVEIHRPDLVAKKLAFLGSNKIIRKQIGTAARKRFLERYTLKIYLMRMNEMFIDVLRN